METLITEQGRKEALTNLTEDCKKSFISSGIELYEKAIIKIDRNGVEISIMHDDPKSSYYGASAFASEINIYAKESSKTGLWDRENEMNFGSSGSFNPKNKESYWRTIHAANCLKNWDKVCEIVNKFCSAYNDLSKNIFELNK